jgi:membrane protein YqaA with SNARE-associated domain
LRSNAPRKGKTSLLALRLLALILVVAISLLIFLFRDRADELAPYGYPGIFLVSFLANATIILPAPGIAVVFAMGSVFPPAGVALAAGLGATLGELVGYLAGFSGRAVVENQKGYTPILAWMSGHRVQSYAVIFALAFIPNPFFDLAGIAAGVLRIPILPFLLIVFLGKTLKMLLFAVLGERSIDWLLR